MKDEQDMFWNCVSCLYTWEDDKSKYYKECPKCKSAFIMSWDLKDGERKNS